MGFDLIDGVSVYQSSDHRRDSRELVDHIFDENNCYTASAQWLCPALLPQRATRRSSPKTTAYRPSPKSTPHPSSYSLSMAIQTTYTQLGDFVLQQLSNYKVLLLNQDSSGQNHSKCTDWSQWYKQHPQISDTTTPPGRKMMEIIDKIHREDDD
jgi:hypothetical protein